MRSKQHYDKQAQDRQTHRTGAAQHIYHQTFATIMLVSRDFARVVSRGIIGLVTRLKTLALPAGNSVAAMLAKGVTARLGAK